MASNTNNGIVSKRSNCSVDGTAREAEGRVAGEGRKHLRDR